MAEKELKLRMRGFLDRVEDGEQAVILIDDIQKALVIPMAELPKGSKEGTYFNIEEKSGQFRVLSIDKRATEREAKKRSEEHTSELQSRGHLVCRLLLEKKKNKYKQKRVQRTN